MEFLLSVNLWMIVAPLLILQYGLAIFCLTRLAYCNLSVKAYVLWNLIILLVVFVGSGVFLFYYFLNRKKLRAEKQDETKPDTLIVDAPTDEAEENKMSELFKESDKTVLNKSQSETDEKAEQTNDFTNPNDGTKE